MLISFDNKEFCSTKKKKNFKNLRNLFLDIHIRNGMPKFLSCILNGGARIERKHIIIPINPYD